MTVRDGGAIRTTIGQVAEVFGLTCRAIRFYEERGLISPARDALNRRVFDQAARHRLELISALRRSHMSLPDIQDVLHCSDGPAAQLELALAKLQAQRHRLERQLDDVKSAYEHLAGGQRAAA